MKTVRLYAEDLYSKFGFSDGDLLKNLVDSNMQHRVLIEVVKRKLLPMLPSDFEFYTFSTIHNPIRAEDDGEEMPETFKCIYVEVSEEEISKIEKQLSEEDKENQL